MRRTDFTLTTQAVRWARIKPVVEELDSGSASRSEGLKLAGDIRYGLNRWAGLCHVLDNGRIEITSDTVERAIRPIALTESFCTPFVSTWKHWELLFWSCSTRAALLPERCRDLLGGEVGGADLVRCIGHGLSGCHDARLDQLTNLVMADAQLGRGIRH